MNLHDIEKLQARMKKEISRAIKKNKLQYSIELIDAYADSCQRINNILRDDEIESYLRTISESYIDRECSLPELDAKTVVLYDQIGTTICLGLQYLRALVDKGYNVVYIYESPIHPIKSDMLEEVKKVCKDYYIFSSRKVFDLKGKYLANEIRRIILKYRPANIIMHQEATGALAMTLMYSLAGITRYKIIPGDHHFYLGYDCFDYFLDFRPFGWSTSHYERRLPIDKIINNTYYPIINDNLDFQGFPSDTDGKVIVLSGGASYKFEGSNVFYELLEHILTIDGVVFVFMGKPTSKLVEMKNDSRYANKIFFLGYRKDFSQVLKKIHILFNSYPFSGGLFCQTAAYYQKPIIAYSKDSLRSENCVEDILGLASNGSQITTTSIESFKKQVEKLIEDHNYYIEKGNECKKMLVTKEYFDNRLDRILRGECEHIPYNFEYVDRSERIAVNIQNNNKIEPCVFLFPSKVLGLRFFYFMRFLKLDLIKHFWYIFVHAFSNNVMLRKILMKKD